MRKKQKVETWTDCNTEVAKGLNITRGLELVLAYRRNWTRRVNRMSRNRLLKIVKTTDQKAEGTRENH